MSSGDRAFCLSCSTKSPASLRNSRLVASLENLLSFETLSSAAFLSSMVRPRVLTGVRPGPPISRTISCSSLFPDMMWKSKKPGPPSLSKASSSAFRVNWAGTTSMILSAPLFPLLISAIRSFILSKRTSSSRRLDLSAMMLSILSPLFKNYIK